MIANHIAVHVHLVSFFKSVITELTARAQMTFSRVYCKCFFISSVFKLNINERLPGYEHAPQADHIGLSNAWCRLKAM